MKSNRVTIQMKVTEQYFHKVLLIFSILQNEIWKFCGHFGYVPFFFIFAGLSKPYAIVLNGYSCALLNRAFQSCPMPLFQSEAKSEAIHIYSPAKKTRKVFRFAWL